MFVRGIGKAVFELQVSGACTPPATPCRARIVKRLSEAEVAALPDRDRPQAEGRQDYFAVILSCEV